jgi:hypothetical protein
MRLRFTLVAVVVAVGAPSAGWADDHQPSCALSSSLVNQIQSQLQTVVNLSGANGGLFAPNRM